MLENLVVARYYSGIGSLKSTNAPSYGNFFSLVPRDLI